MNGYSFEKLKLDKLCGALTLVVHELETNNKQEYADGALVLAQMIAEQTKVVDAALDKLIAEMNHGQ